MGKMKATLDQAPVDGGGASNVTSISAAKGKRAGKASPATEKPPSDDSAAIPTLIVFGKDEAGKAHAAWFGPADAEAAERAAGFMKMRVLRVVTPERRALALQTAVGRIFESGKGFVPFAKMALHDRLNAEEGAFDPPAPVVPEPEPNPVAASVPRSWGEFGPGALVLASADPDDGWWPSIIIESRGEDLFVLRWQGWPDEPSFVRRGADLGLMPPSATLPTTGPEPAAAE